MTALAVRAASASSVAGPVLRPAPAAIRIRALRAVYGDHVAVESLDLEVAAGSCVGLLGPNGAGKTTTLEILEGLRSPAAGEVEILGTTWRADPAGLRRRTGAVLQDTRFQDRLTVAETVRMFRSFYPAGLAVDEALELVDLAGDARRRVGALSGGQRQRLAIATAVVGAPEVLFLDEPTVGLDPISRMRLWSLVGELRRRGTTIVVSTHYLAEAEALCDRVAILDRGRLVAEGAPRDLARPAAGPVRVSVRTSRPLSRSALERLPAVRRVVVAGADSDLELDSLHAFLPALLALLDRIGATLLDCSTTRATLEDVFVRLTGGEP
jgi:ABC-2 type transport system ATP-binding protein